jgi:hypothetical protein
LPPDLRHATGNVVFQALDDRHVDRLPLVNARGSPVKRPPFGLNRKVPPKCNEIKLGLPIP